MAVWLVIYGNPLLRSPNCFRRSGGTGRSDDPSRPYPPDDIEAIAEAAARRTFELFRAAQLQNGRRARRSADRSNGATSDLSERILAFLRAADRPVSLRGVRQGVRGRAVHIDAGLRDLARGGKARRTDGRWEVCPVASDGRDAPSESVVEPAGDVEAPSVASGPAAADEAPTGQLAPLADELTTPPPAVRTTMYDPFGDFS